MTKSIPLALKLLESGYGQPKMHEVRDPNSIPPFRSMVSSIGTFNYELAKYLSILLEPHIPSKHYTLDSFTFVRKINECLYWESSWFPLMSKVCLQTYPWRSVSTWRLTTSPGETLISS